MTVPDSSRLQLRMPDLAFPRPAPGPWALAHFARASSLWLIAFALLAVAWAGSRADADPTHGGLWILLGLLGGMIAAAGSTVWLLAGLRSVRDREQRLTARIAALTPGLEQALGIEMAIAPDPVQAADELKDTTPITGLVRVEQGTRYHRAECLLVAGKPLIELDGVDLTLTPCGVCRP